MTSTQDIHTTIFIVINDLAIIMDSSCLISEIIQIQYLQ